MAENTTEAVERLTELAGRFERGEIIGATTYAATAAADLRALLSERNALVERVERAERERDEARAGERNMAEHARRVADEANEAFAAAEALDEFWAASGYAGNRGHMTPAEQVSSIIRERDSSDDRAQAAESKLATLTEALEWFSGQRRLSLEWCQPVYGDDEDDAEEWRVHRVSGPVNDREWEMVGAGDTALKAILDARQTIDGVPALNTEEGR